MVIACASVVVIAFSLTKAAAAQSSKSFVAEIDFCDVEIREGNTPYPEHESSVQIYRGSMNKDGSFSTAKSFLFARRESQPPHCNSGRANWQVCSWDRCIIH